jgi:kynureninase
VRRVLVPNRESDAGVGSDSREAAGMTVPVSRADCDARDATDPLAPLRTEFALDPGLIYLDGNSLGPLTHAAARRVESMLHAEWGRDLIKSWNVHGWIDLPRRLGARIARLVGAAADEVLVADSTSVNLFKLAAAACRTRGGRRQIVSEAGNFPTDLYVLQGLSNLTGGEVELVAAPRERIYDAIDENTFLVVLTHVHYKSGERFDMVRLTERAHAVGARILWDLSHSVGAFPVDLTGSLADFAVGCTYKYLNGGPGSPAFLYVRRDLQALVEPALAGWMGHAAPFEFSDGYQPAPGVARHCCGTPSLLSFAALDGALDVFDHIDLAQLRRKSLELSALFIATVESGGALAGLDLASPRDAARRGSHLVFAHPAGYEVMQSLIARGVIGDFRAPDLLRFGFAPLYIRYADVWDAAMRLRAVLESGSFRPSPATARAAVT